MNLGVEGLTSGLQGDDSSGHSRKSGFWHKNLSDSLLRLFQTHAHYTRQRVGLWFEVIMSSSPESFTVHMCTQIHKSLSFDKLVCVSSPGVQDFCRTKKTWDKSKSTAINVQRLQALLRTENCSNISTPEILVVLQCAHCRRLYSFTPPTNTQLRALKDEVIPESLKSVSGHCFLL